MSEPQLIFAAGDQAIHETIPASNVVVAKTPATEDAAFTSNCDQLLVGEQKFQLRILKMNGATMLFVGNTEPECMDEMGVAMPMSTGDGAQILATSILGPSHIASDSQRLAEKLSKRFRRQFFVSYNVQLDRISAPLLERHLSDYVRSHEALFT